MSSFWADKLGARPAPAPAPSAAPQQPPQAGAWWQQPTAYARAAAPPPAPAEQSAPYVPTRIPQHQREGQGNCPECGSADFYRANPRVAPRCYSCGWPIRHSTSGTAIVNNTSGEPKAARQIKGAGYRPDIIVGHV